jgi:alpha-mannosidase
MLECARRYRDFPGLVKTRYSTAEEALDSIRASAEQAEIPVWHDELYLEAHRGTYTTKGRLKKLNRRCELLYREAELAASLAWASGSEYPAGELRDGWLKLLTAQFHDSLPGTHVNQVYHDLLSEYESIESIGNTVRDRAMGSLVHREVPDDTADKRAEQTLVVFNSLLHTRTDFASIPAALVAGRTIVGPDGRLVQQRVTDLDGTERVVVRVPEIPGVGYRLLKVVPEPPSGDMQASARVAAEAAAGGRFCLENEWIRAVFTSDGELCSLKDKVREREIIPPGLFGNKFQLFEDAPGAYDAWDIISGYREHEIELSAGSSLQVEESGPLCASLLLRKPCRQSSITQRITLYAGSPMLVFETRVDWVERQKLLKVAFPVEANCHRATYDIAFGNIERPNYANTSHDAARFEVPAHQWMDLSEGDYGVSLLNDCKYGHEAAGKVMRLSLLKGSISPDPSSDIGEHHFTYCLYLHDGTWREAGTIQRALDLNNPLYVGVVDKTDKSLTQQFIHCDAANLTLEAIKRSEDGRHLLVRLVERHNCRTQAALTFDRPVVGAWLCDLMEREETALTPQGDKVTFPVAPYEIVTLRVAMQTERR